MLKSQVKTEYNIVMWSEEEEKFLRENPDMSLADLARTLNRSVGAVRAKRSRMGIGKSSERWTDDEIRILLENRNGVIADLQNLLPRRTPAAIRSKLNYLGRKRK